MCQEIQMQPDVHSLLEWSQYLAPAIATSRFDTLFYLTALPETYPCAIAADDHETASADVCQHTLSLSPILRHDLLYLVVGT